jgi:hypothetical protein
MPIPIATPGRSPAPVEAPVEVRPGEVEEEEALVVVEELGLVGLVVVGVAATADEDVIGVTR